MKLSILPDSGFELNTERFNWSEDRASVRQKLQHTHKEDDRLIEMAHFFNGDKSHDIDQRRDIYHDINGTKNYFFLNYDKENRLSELEVHSGINVWIDTIELIFEKDIKNYLNQLKSLGYDFTEIELGNYVFESLKISIADSKSIGGEGNGLAYLYSGKDIQHLIEK